MLAAKLSRPLTVLCLAVWPLVLAATASAAVPLPGGGEVQKVDFERHVMGLFGRAGCASGSCHGSFQGKGGFRLSLFGYEPNKDYLALTRDVLGRRVDRVNPDDSLLLLKSAGQIEHGGGMRFSKTSWQYKVFREWIVSGSPWTKGSGEVKSIRITPTEAVFTKSGESAQLRVLATFADGAEEDITPFCDFRTNDDAIADVSNIGLVTGRRAGDTAIVVSYRGQMLPVRTLVPYEAKAGFVFPKVPEVNYIDREVFAKLRRLNMVPSDLSDDAEFLRRVTIDTIGSLPTPEEIRAFLADKNPDKREKKIDELLAHPLHAALWATKFSDITGNNTDSLENPQQLKAKRSQMWQDWFRKRVAENVPYDEIVRGILCATSRDGNTAEDWAKELVTVHGELDKGFTTSYPERKSLDLFWKRQQQVPIEQWGEKTAVAFMGIRLECAQCHKHPFDRWTQADYRAFANVFGRIATNNVSADSKKAIDEVLPKLPMTMQGNNKVPTLVREVYISDKTSASLVHPDTNAPLSPKAPGGPEIKHEAGKDARVALFDWLRSPDNPFFARSFVNRAWGHYFGVGIVDPVDDFSLANPPSNDKLLDALAKDFLDSKFDIRRVEKTILMSRTYQLSSTINASNRLDRKNFSHGYTRPMLAEVVVDVLNSALGTTENWGPDAPSGCRAIEMGVSRLANQNLNYAFRIFGKSPRTSACDCEKSIDPALTQKLYLMTDQNLLAKFNAPTGRLQTLLKSNKSDDEVLEELFLATLGRNPTESDKKFFTEYKARAKNRNALFADTVWALINTREFILNH